jgi:hypothetical protein
MKVFCFLTAGIGRVTMPWIAQIQTVSHPMLRKWQQRPFGECGTTFDDEANREEVHVNNALSTSGLCVLLLAFSASAESNNVLQTEIWPQLYLTNDIDRFEGAIAQLKAYAQAPSNRVELIDFVRGELAKPILDNVTQSKLGLIVRVLQHSAYTNDSKTIRELVKENHQFVVFYSDSLIEMSPMYIDLSFDVFTNLDDIISYRNDFEAGKMSAYILQDEILLCLKERTKKDYGKNRDAWLRWWRSEGRFWTYDLETGTYNPAKSAVKSTR